jgi:perosamine synthetase
MKQGEMFIPISKPSITQLEIDNVMDAVSSSWISSLGKYIDEFESKFAEFCDVKYAVAVSNGTVAIHLALVCSGITEGDEVIVPNLSFIATANTVYHAGATPIFADIDPFNYCLDPKDIIRKITKKTKAIIPVHLYGHPAEMGLINKIAEDYGLIVIEDAAEAHGATVHGKRVGGLGHCATFSFYGNKNFTTGEGGMITTNDYDLYMKLRYLRDHGMSKEKRYWHTEVGYNYRMTNIQAAIGCAQLDRADSIMAKRQEIFNWYNSFLPESNRYSLNRTYPWASNAYWLMTLEVFDYSEEQRDQLMVDLRNRNIDSRPFFYPMSDMPYINIYADTPNVRTIFKQGINLPTFFDLTKEEVNYICENLNDLLK